MVVAEKENLDIYMKDLILNDEQIKVQCSHTNFVNHLKVKKQDLKQVLKLHAEIVSLCRANKIKVSYKLKSKARLTELIKNGEYENYYSNYDLVYNKLLAGWKTVLAKGYYDPYIDDKFYKNELRELWFSIQTMFNVGSALGDVSKIVNRLVDLKSRLTESPENFISITL